MTQTSRNSGRPAASTQELRDEVEHARDELADTVAQLAAKADIASRARQRAGRARARVQQGRHAADQGSGRQQATAAAGAGVFALVVLAAILYRKRHT